MTTKEYIESGLLELYVCGSLSTEEQARVAEDVTKDPELQKEVEAIEAALMKLSKATSPGLRSTIKNDISLKIKKRKSSTTPKVRVITSNYSYFGWAASILLLGGILWLLKLNQDLKEEIRVSSQELKNKETQIVDSNEKAERLENLLQEVAQPNTKKLNLPGNELNAPNAFVTAFYNEEREELILDTSQLPDPPEGMVYQAWSLTFEPLTPRSIGVLAQVSSIDNNLFKLQGIPNSEGFGITLEPDGGSDTPNLEQLYALGTI